MSDKIDATRALENILLALAKACGKRPSEIVADMLDLWAFDDTNQTERVLLQTAAQAVRAACPPQK